MSADNGIFIEKKKDGKWIVSQYCASVEDYERGEEFNTLEEAVEHAKTFHTEYGITFI